MCKAAAKVAGSYRDVFALDTDGYSDSTKGTMEKLAGEGGIPAYELQATAPVVALAALVNDSPLAQTVQGTSDEDTSLALARSLCDIAAPTSSDATAEPKVLPDMRQMPKFKVSCAGDGPESVELFFAGNIPEDLTVKATDSRGTVTLDETVDPRTAMVQLQLDGARAPYFVILGSAMRTTDLPEFDIDFDCDNAVTIDSV